MVEVTDALRRRFAYAALALEVLFLILFATTTEYSENSQPGAVSDVRASATTEVDHYYPMFQDVHVMIFIGFGFLMTFLKRYGFGAIGFNFMLSAMVIQWSMLTNGFFHSLVPVSATTCEHAGAGAHGNKSSNFLTLTYGSAAPFAGCAWHKVQLGITNLITSDFAAGAVMISFGAILGKASPLQLLFMGIFEMLFYGINETIGAGLLGAVDMGGSIFVHTFGAYFGLAVSMVMAKQPVGASDDHKDNSSSKESDTFAMIGTVFLWMFWPSFNGALATESQQHRVVLNTVLALSACCMSAFAFSALLRKGNKFDMVDIQNATLAGGVAVGSSADLVIQPYGAIIIGLVAGALSVAGYVYVSPFLQRTIGLDDTCGVHNLHGMPGILGALGGCVSSAMAGTNLYGSSVGIVFPERCGTFTAAQAKKQLGDNLYAHIAGDAGGTFYDNSTKKTYVATASMALESIADGNPAHGIDTAIANSIKAVTGCSSPGSGRGASEQALMQVLAVVITVAIAIVGGLITGAMMKACRAAQGQADYVNWYNDSQYWETPDEEENPFLDSSYHGEVNDNEVNAKVGEDTMQANPGSEIAMTASKKEMASE